jgi:hypothetical protein
MGVNPSGGKFLLPFAGSIAPFNHSFHETFMDDRKLIALAKKNAAKSGTNSKVPKGFGKKYDTNLADDPTDEATIKAREESKKFFSEMKKRDF